MVRSTCDARDPIGIGERAVEPVGGGVGGRDQEADPGGRGERTGSVGRGPPPADEQQVGDEDQRRQLDRRGDADTHPAPPPVTTPEQVGHHHGEEHDVDLTEVEGGAHRVQAGCERGEQQRRPERRTGGHADAAGAPVHDEAQQAETRGRPDDLEHAERQQRQWREHRSRERRIDERQFQEHAAGIERLAVQHVLPARPVHLQVDHEQMRCRPQREHDGLSDERHARPRPRPTAAAAACAQPGRAPALSPSAPR